MLEALSRDFRVGVPWELFFADDLVIIATSLEECVERVKAWKEGLESKGLRYPARLRQVPMCRVPYGSRQVIHPVLQMQPVGSL